MVKVCLKCHLVFEAPGAGAKFCSRKCYYDSKRTRVEVERNCLYCGKLFTTTDIEIKYGKGIFCSALCSRRGRRPTGFSVHHQVRMAIKAGMLIPKPCAKCGAENVIPHHGNYAKPLDVSWLCPTCHAKLHCKQQAKRNEPRAPRKPGKLQLILAERLRPPTR